jgi:uncharacterized protein (DUF608 family)
MVQHSMGRVIAGAVITAAVCLYGIGYGYTAPGSQAAEQTETGNYPLGCPMGGIGGGNFNFLMDGNYNTTYIRVAVTSGAPPTCLCFSKRGTTTFWATDMQHGNSGNGNMTTTFTGYWPTVTMNYAQTGMLHTIVLKAFSPICAGDNKNSSLPLCIYKFTITNSGTAVDTAAIALQNSANSTIIRYGTRVVGIASGTICVMVDTAKVNAADSITCGSSNSGFTTTGLLNNGAAGYLAKRVVVPAGQSRTVTFSVAWTGVSNGYYRNYFTNVQLLAAHGRDSAVSLESKVDNWHNKILNSNLPDWLKDLVINSCHTYNSMTDWTNSGTYGTYGMAESMSSGNYGCIDQSYHGSMALPIFAPNAAWSEIQRIVSVQHTNSGEVGLISHFYGQSANEVRSDGGAKLILQALRNYMWTGNAAALNSMWSNYVSAITGIRNLDTDADGLADDNLMNTYDNPMWDGWIFPKKEYDNELDLAAMRAMQKIAVVHGSTADSATYRGYYNTTSTGFERANSSGFWNTTMASRSGYTGYYTGSTNITGNGRSVWPCLLEGQWYADLCGLGPVHPEARIQSSCRIVQDVCCDQTTIPSYYYMIAWPPNGATHYSSGPGYVCYGEYPAGGMCVAFQHNLPDISMRALHYYWNITMSKWHRVYNVPCKVLPSGAGTDWGINRYMFPPGVFASLFGITGFVPDIAGRSLRVKPSLPTSTQYRLAGDSLAAAPLMNPISLGTVDYRNNTTAPYQRFVIRFDSPLQFDRFYTKKLYSPSVTVRKPAVGGSPVTASIAVNSADTSEYVITFGSTLTIDSSGVLITIPSTVGTRHGQPLNTPALDFAVDVKRGTISYLLPQRTTVDIYIVNPLGERMMVIQSEEAAGSHVVRYDWKNRAPGVYCAYLRTGEGAGVKKVVHVK